MIGLVGFPLLTLILTADRSQVVLSTALSAYLILVIVIAVVGGIAPALLGSHRRLPSSQLVLQPAHPHLHHRRTPVTSPH